MNIETFDLNLLRVLAAVHAQRSVSRAAAALGLSQPAVSNALLRLRRACGDPLFVRTRHGMAPTAMADRLIGPVREALGLLQVAIEAPGGFDPARSERRFRLLASDIGESVVLPPLMRALRRAAPGVGIETAPMPRDRYGAALEDGTADLAIGNLALPASGFYQQRLFDDPYCCVVGRAHAALGDRIALDRFLDAAHVAVASGNADALLERELLRRRRRRVVTLRVSQYRVALEVVATTALIATVPRNAVRGAAGVRVLPLPVRLAPAVVRQFWHRRAHDDPGHRWLRAAIAALRFEPRRRTA